MSEAKAERAAETTTNDGETNSHHCMQQLAIVERYEQFVDYVYPIFLGVRRAHHVVRDGAIAAMLRQVELFNEAGKSTSVSKLYAADANLALLRFYLRFFASPKRKLMSQHQHQVAAIHVAETGRMLGAWIARAQKTAKRPTG